MEEEGLIINPFALIFVTIIVFGIFMMIFEFNYLEIYGNNNENKHITFYVLFEFNIRAVYRCQRKDTMNVLINGVQTVMKKHVERPAVLLFLTPSDAYFTALSLARTLAIASLVAFGRHWCPADLNKIFLHGSWYSAFEDYWRFYKKLMKRINHYGVVVIESFQALHPQVSTVLCNIADDTFSPFPRCVIILIMDVNDYFTQNAIATKQAIILAEIYLRTCFGPFLDEDTTNELLRVVSGRTVIIQREKHIENI